MRGKPERSHSVPQGLHNLCGMPYHPPRGLTTHAHIRPSRERLAHFPEYCFQGSSNSPRKRIGLLESGFKSEDKDLVRCVQWPKFSKRISKRGICTRSRSCKGYGTATHTHHVYCSTILHSQNVEPAYMLTSG